MNPINPLRNPLRNAPGGFRHLPSTTPQVVSPEEAMQRLMQAAGPGAGGSGPVREVFLEQVGISQRSVVFVFFVMPPGSLR